MWLSLWGMQRAGEERQGHPEDGGAPSRQRWFSFTLESSAWYVQARSSSVPKSGSNFLMTEKITLTILFSQSFPV